MAERTLKPYLLRADDGDVTGMPSSLDRYLVDSAVTGATIALVEHIVAPNVLAAPLHRHSREDEYSYVLAGTLGVIQDDVEMIAVAGDLVTKPKGHWHTFWNAGDENLRVLEIIAPGGLEELFRRLGEAGAEYDLATLPALAAEYGCEIDLDGTMLLVERHRLQF